MTKPIIEVFFDVETKSFFDESGASKPEELGVSIVSVYRREMDEYFNEIQGEMKAFGKRKFPKCGPSF